jgi:ankyrin repeat protein
MATKAEGIIKHEPENIAALVPGIIEEDSDIKTIRLLIESGMDISAMTWGENRTNALHVAAANEKTADLIDAILETKKFDINGVDNDGNTPLHHAIMGSDSRKKCSSSDSTGSRSQHCRQERNHSTAFGGQK